MDFYSLVPANRAQFEPPVLNNATHSSDFIHSASQVEHYRNILANMAANHSIIMIQATGELIGDPMEIKVFEFGKFSLNESLTDPNVIFGFESQRGQSGLVFRRFEFDADLQRMSVICKGSAKDKCDVFAKGSPEMMLTIMLPESVPKNYDEVLKEYASHGFRVLAIASKVISEDQMMTIGRSEAEENLIFNGFEVFENKLKGETKGAIQKLKQAEVGCVMITGDNSLTGSNISYKCDISDKRKGMIICDFVNGSYAEENFEFKDEIEE